MKGFYIIKNKIHAVKFVYYKKGINKIKKKVHINI